jgi:hypothetical protein
MQLADRLAATLLALTWITPVAQAATALRDFTLIDGTGPDPVPGSTLIVEGGRAAETYPGYRYQSGMKRSGLTWHDSTRISRT